MPTCFGGTVNLTVVVSADEASVNVEAIRANFAVQPVEIRMRLRSGDGRPSASAEINGASAPVRAGDTIELPVTRDGTYRVVGQFR
jgi:hypothetical protein